MAARAVKRMGQKAAKAEEAKITALKEIDKSIDDIYAAFSKLEPKDHVKALDRLGVGSKYFTCQGCGRIKQKKDFYVSTEPNCATGITKLCKACATEIAMPIRDGKRSQPTKATVDDALYALNKPFLDAVWDSSLLEAANTTTAGYSGTRSNVWTAYIKNIQLQQYYTLTYRQSDNYTGGMYSLETLEEAAAPKDQIILEEFEKNKNDVLRLIGYLPFEKERLSDQPQLYAQLVGMLDSADEGNDDMMRVSSIISIVRGFLRLSQLDDMTATIVNNPSGMEKNLPAVKTLQTMEGAITSNITKLAEQSCISLKHTRNAVKGENTWTGKIKKIKDLNLREGEVNGFDMETCKAMRQVMDMSHASILKQLRLDESEYSDMLAEQRDMIVKLQRRADACSEAARILLRENTDLKDFITESGLDISVDLVDLTELFSAPDLLESPTEDSEDGE